MGWIVKVPADNPHGNEFAKILGKKWSKVTEPEQREFQKAWFRHVNLLQKEGKMLDGILVEFAKKYPLVKKRVSKFIKSLTTPKPAPQVSQGPVTTASTPVEHFEWNETKLTLKKPTRKSPYTRKVKK